jgi:bifunctional NMN adenylyltransferase/nudix hydrolase
MNTHHTLGVIVGRFQVPELHAGHRHLIEYSLAHNEKTLIVIGSGRGLATERNPLPYSVRQAMMLEAYPLVRVIEHFDHPSDEVWSTRLDALIDIVFPGHRPTLYGSRDSFIPHYSGVNKVELIPDIESVTGTALRESVKEHVACSSPFRSGIIHTHATRFPIVYPVVDVAIINPERRMVLLGEKETDQGKRRFIGGFVDTTLDDSYEHAARREAFEETGGLEVDAYTYLGSIRIDDWRYRGSKDCVMSSFFKAQYIFGQPRASDDIDALHWTPFEEVMERLAESHKPLGEMLMRSLDVAGT